LCVHFVITQSLLRGQLHQIFKDLYANHKKIFSTSIFNFSVTKFALFLYFHLLEHEEAAGLDSVVDLECRTESTHERWFGRSFTCGHMFIFVSFTKATTTPPRKWRRLRFWNRHGKLAALALAPGLICFDMFNSGRLKTRNRPAAKNLPGALAQNVPSFETSASTSVDTA
jgi:hypothetical protein